MKRQRCCRLVFPILLLLCGTCIVYGNEDTCEFLPNFNCTVKITGTYGFNIYNPDILDQVSILNMAEFTELCSDYKVMELCLNENRPCDSRSRRFTEYALAVAKGLDYACQKKVLEDYGIVEECFNRTEVRHAYNACHKDLRRSIQELVNETIESALTSRIDISVVVEKACHLLIDSMECTANVLLDSCGSFVNDWYREVFTEMIKPTLRDYRCLLHMPVVKIIQLCLVCLAGAIVLGVFSYVIYQRYKSLVRSRMNFVLSVLPKATFRSFDPKRITDRISTSRATTELPSTEQTPPPADTSRVSHLPPIDPATAHILQEFARASQQTAPGQRNVSASGQRKQDRTSTTPATSTTTTPAASTSSWFGWFNN